MAANAPLRHVVVVTPNPEGIPASLRARRQWISWRYEWDARKAKWLKIPKNPHTGRNAMANNPETWGTFEEAWRSFQERGHDGVAYVTTADDGILVLDFDGCVGKDGTIEAWARGDAQRAHSWAQRSVSGTGFHLFVEAAPAWDDDRPWVTLKVPGARNLGKMPAIELIAERRFICMTGRPPEGLPRYDDIAPRQDLVDEIYGRLREEERAKAKARANGHGHRTVQPQASPSASLAPEELLRQVRALPGEDGEDARRLLDRGVGVGENHSVKDIQLLIIMAKVTQHEPTLDAAFRLTPLMRPEKWDERHHADGSTYGERTIERAIERVQEQPEHDAAPSPNGHHGAADDRGDGHHHAAQGHCTAGSDEVAELKRQLAAAQQALAAKTAECEQWRRDHSSLAYAFVNLLARGTALERRYSKANQLLRWITDVIANEARAAAKAGEKARAVVTPLDRVVTVNAMLEASCVPGVHERGSGEGDGDGADEPEMTRIRLDRIAQRSGCSKGSASRSLSHAKELGFIRKEVVQVSPTEKEVRIGPGRAISRYEQLSLEADFRVKARQRACQCGSTRFIHKIICAECGSLVQKEVNAAEDPMASDGPAEGAVADLAHQDTTTVVGTETRGSESGIAKFATALEGASRQVSETVSGPPHYACKGTVYRILPPTVGGGRICATCHPPLPSRADRAEQQGGGP
jgi:hypothetical protein